MQNFSLGNIAGYLSKNMDFRVLRYLLETFGKNFTQIFFSDIFT
jgi:hypothetical protein